MKLLNKGNHPTNSAPASPPQNWSGVAGVGLHGAGIPYLPIALVYTSIEVMIKRVLKAL